MRLRIAISIFLANVIGIFGTALAEPLPVDTIRALAQQNTRQAIALFREFLSLPNDANYPDDIDRMVAWMEVAFSERDFDVRQIATV